MLEYNVVAHRIDGHGSEAATKQATLTLDTDMNGRPDAFNPAQLFRASIGYQHKRSTMTSAVSRWRHRSVK